MNVILKPFLIEARRPNSYNGFDY